MISQSSTSLKISFDLICVLTVVPLQLLIELTIPLIDVVYVFLFHKSASPRELSSFGNLLLNLIRHPIDSLLLGQ